MTDMTPEQALIMDLRNRLLNETANPVCCGQYDDDPNGGPLCCGKPEADIPEDVAALVARADEALSRPAVPAGVRESFERWAPAAGMLIDRDETGRYEQAMTRHYWLVWQAAKADSASGVTVVVAPESLADLLAGKRDYAPVYRPSADWKNGVPLFASPAPAPAVTLYADALAQEIRRVDGNHSLGAAALAEALMPFLCRHPPAPDRCPHGVRLPHECKECADAVPGDAAREWAAQQFAAAPAEESSGDAVAFAQLTRVAEELGIDWTTFDNDDGFEAGIERLADAVIEAANDRDASEPVLDKPARVGAGTFGVGVKWRTVIAAAQRQHEYHQEGPPSVNAEAIRNLIGRPAGESAEGGSE